MRQRALGRMAFCILMLTAITPAQALASAGSVGGTAPVTTPAVNGSSTPKAPAHTAPAPAHTAPVTSRSRSLVYNGPVYVRSATGQLVPYQQVSGPEQLKAQTGGAAVGVAAGLPKPQLLVPGHTARIVDGLAAAPIYAPATVQQMIWAANQIIGLPYIFGGGHGSFSSPGYDCSGTVSFALHGASLLSTPEDSSEFMGYGQHGVGTWVTVFTNPGHAYMTVAGVRLDTSAADDPSNQQGPRWRPLRPANRGFTVRHPAGL